MSFLSGGATGTLPPFKGQHLTHAHSDKPNQMHGTHTHRKKQQIFATRDDCSSMNSRFSFYAVLPVPVMFPVLSGDMNIKIWSQSRQVARDRTRVFRVPSLNNGHHPDTMITAAWHRGCYSTGFYNTLKI